MSTVADGFAQSTGEGWAQVADFGLALLLSGLIGLEREWRQKDAGLRTYTVVGIGAALFMLISKYGFGDVVHQGTVQLDPSRVAAQIVSGVGFIGAGLIFTQRGSVHGLTSAAGIWMTAAVGAACGAGLPILAALCTAAYLALSLTKPFTAKIAEHVEGEDDDGGDGHSDGDGGDGARKGR
ncbi:MAG TPA: MgtC/SapB family protein [Actinospica sp.]|jgi:putative Mg2+ transporter-C (MgtC) family protein|nr:MgtC/SapB family protein [Actinospica sp.]HWG24739.1 MgtC/SapB family protein [Actinospica sp.]